MIIIIASAIGLFIGFRNSEKSGITGTTKVITSLMSSLIGFLVGTMLGIAIIGASEENISSRVPITDVQHIGSYYYYKVGDEQFSVPEKDFGNIQELPTGESSYVLVNYSDVVGTKLRGLLWYDTTESQKDPNQVINKKGSTKDLYVGQ